MTTPVALFIFNRPLHTERVLEAIRGYQPSRLLVVADGPRSNAERAQCLATRAIIDRVNWDCEVLTNYSDVNLGCKVRVSSGLDWVFSQCEEAIILEDDCLPDPSFFPFCEDLLDYYHDNDRVMAISGDNFQGGHIRGEGSYYFSRYPHCWGWASWRRAWNRYDVSMSRWSALPHSTWLDGLLGSESAVTYWRDIFDRTAAGEIDTWDYQWTFACWANDGVAALPNVNLVSNIGFGAQATHTLDPSSPLALLPASEVPFPLRHPDRVAIDKDADAWTLATGFAPVRSGRGSGWYAPRGLAARVRSILIAGRAT